MGESDQDLGGTVVIPPAEEREQENGHGGVATETEGEVERERALASLAGPPDAAAYVAALLRRREIELGQVHVDAAPVVPGVNWVPLGPSVIANPDSGLWQSVSGRVEDMVVGPGGTRAYIASTWGGAWMTPDGGATWTPINDYVTVPSYALGGADVSSLTTGALAVRFGSMASTDLVYVGTGSGSGGIGVLSSPSGGAAGSWTREATNLAGRSFNAIVIDPDNPAVVLAATDRGIYRRPTSGSTAIWTQVSGAFSNPFGDALHLTVAGSGASKRFYCAFASDRVYSSLDGTTWTAVPGFTVNAYGIRLAIAESDTTVVYALNGDGALYRLSSGSFRTVSGLTFAILSPGGQLPYDMVLAVDPSDANTIYLGADYTPANGALSFYRGTVSGGPTSFTFPFNPANAGNPSADPTWMGQGIHPDAHAIAFGLNAAGTAHDPADLWLGCDGGVYRSTTPSTRGTYKARNTGLADAIPRYLAQRPDTDAVLFAGSQDNGTIRSVGEQVWSWRIGGDGGGVAVNPANQYQVMREESDGFLAASGDGGSTWPLPVNFPPAGASGATERNNMYPYTGLVTTPPGATPAALFFATNRLWMTTNWGTSWVTLPSATDPYSGGTPDFTRDTIDGNAILALTAASGTVVYAASRTVVRRYELNAGTWSKTDITGPSVGSPYAIYAIAVENAAAGTFYAVLGSGNYDHVHYWDGAAWHVAMPASVVNTGAFCAVVDPLNPLTLYVGTDVGVWKGVKASATSATWSWSLFSNGLPEASVQDIAIHDRTRLLRALTGGRGIWEYPLDVTSVPDPDIYMRVNTADTGRITAAGTRNSWVDGAPDPLVPGRLVHHWMSADIKVRRGSQMGLPPLTLPANQLDFAVNIGDVTDANGIEEADVSGTDLVFVEVHGRTASSVAASQVSVLALTCDASAGLPALPADYASRIRSHDSSNWLSYTGAGGVPTQDWYFLDPATPYRSLTNALDARNPQVVSWSFDFGSLNLPNTHDHVCVAAFVTTTTTADQIPDLGLTSLDQITMRDKHVVHRNLHLLPAGMFKLKSLVTTPHDPQFLLVDFHNPTDRPAHVEIVVDQGELAGHATLYLPPLESLHVERAGLRGVVRIDPGKLGERAEAVHQVWNREVDRLVRDTEEAHPEGKALKLRPDSRTARRVRKVRRLARLDRGVLYALEDQRLCAVEGVVLEPGASVTAALAVSAPGKSRIGDRFTFDVMQRRDGRVVGGSTYVLALARTPLDD